MCHSLYGYSCCWLLRDLEVSNASLHPDILANFIPKNLTKSYCANEEGAGGAPVQSKK